MRVNYRDAEPEVDDNLKEDSCKDQEGKGIRPGRIERPPPRPADFILLNVSSPPVSSRFLHLA